MFLVAVRRPCDEQVTRLPSAHTGSGAAAEKWMDNMRAAFIALTDLCIPSLDFMVSNEV